MRLKDKVALITGAGRGIGRAIAERFAEEGAQIVIAELIMQNARETTALIEAVGGRARAVMTDVADRVQVEMAVQSAVETFGQLDILVNNAAISPVVDFVEGDPLQWEQQIQVNLLGAVYAARAAARVMRPGSCIINISSIHGTRGEKGASAYDVAKGGLDQLTRTLAVQLAERGIRVNAVAPGFIDAPMALVNGVSELETDSFKSQYIKGRRIPLARAGQPAEVAAAVLFLACDDSSYVNGHILVVDGGLSVTF